MKILVVNRYFWPDKTADARIVYEICKFLSKNNHEVDVITSNLSKNIKKNSSKNKFKNFNIFRLFLFKETLSPASRIVNAIKISFLVFIKSLQKRYDIIIVSTIPPILTGFFSTIVSKIIKARVIYYCMDLNPEIGKLSGDFKNKFLYKLLQKLDHWTCQNADPVLVHSIDMLNSLRSRKGGKGYNIQLMNNFSPSSKKKKLDLNLVNKINSRNLNIIYTGNLGRFQNLETLIEAMSYLKHIKDIRLIIMGDGIIKKKIMNMSIKFKANIKFLDAQPIEIAKEMIKKSDLCLVSLVPKMYKYAYPSKIMTYLEQGKPIIFIVEKKSDMVKNMKSEGYGFYLPNTKAKTIANLFEKLSKNKSWKFKMKKNVKKAFKENFSTNLILKKWLNVIETGKVD